MSQAKEIKVEIEGVKRGDDLIKEVVVRNPTAGELRGLHLNPLVMGDVSALIKLIPRITTPSLTEAEVGALSSGDLFAIGGEVTAFLIKS